MKGRPDGLTVSWGSWDPVSVIEKKKGTHFKTGRRGLGRARRLRVQKQARPPHIKFGGGGAFSPLP